MFQTFFRDKLNRYCPCTVETETTTHYFLSCHFYNANRPALMNDLNKIDSSSSTLSSKFIDLFLSRSDKFLGKNTLHKLPGEMCPGGFPGE